MKCRQCGLVNFKDAPACKRCGADLTVSDAAGDDSVAWRDGAVLVWKSTGPLPPRCLRCNSSGRGAYRRVKIAFFPAYNLASWLLAGFLHWKEYTLLLPLCAWHNLSRFLAIVLGVLIIFAGVGLIVATLGYNIDLLYYPGVFLIIAGFVVAAFKGSPISIKKFDAPYFRLRGVHKDYLAQLGPWSK